MNISVLIRFANQTRIVRYKASSVDLIKRARKLLCSKM